MNRLGLIFLILLISTLSFGQKAAKIKLHRADLSNYNEKIAKDAQRLLGNVKLSHDGTIMLCDSAWFFETDNNIKAFGNIRINRGDSLRLIGDKLDYSGKEKIAVVTGDIRMMDNDMTLETDHLIFNIPKNTASYTNGGTIISKENNNILTSKIGNYFTNNETFHFKKDVLLTNPEYTIETDTLHFHEYNNTADFLGPTFIRSENNLIYCENGFYDTNNDIARFGKNAYVWFNDQQLSGDSLFYNRNTGVGIAIGNVSITDTLNNFSINGNFGEHLEKTEVSFVTGKAEYIQIFEGDSLFLHADTLRAIPDTLQKKIIQCYHGAKFYKNDIQGACDSLIYQENDSAFFMYDQPILWSDENQISGDFIKLKTNGKSLKDMWVENNSFIISKVDSVHFNQIKGREMMGFFNENELRKIDVLGNGQLVYFPTEDNEDIIGINKAVCSDIQIRIKDNTITHVNLQKQTDSKFFPLDQASENDLILKGFLWKLDHRPLNREGIFE